jgi:hypothetical protein
MINPKSSIPLKVEKEQIVSTNKYFPSNEVLFFPNHVIIVTTKKKMNCVYQVNKNIKKLYIMECYTNLKKILIRHCILSETKKRTQINGDIT